MGSWLVGSGLKRSDARAMTLRVVIAINNNVAKASEISRKKRVEMWEWTKIARLMQVKRAGAYTATVAALFTRAREII